MTISNFIYQKKINSEIGQMLQELATVGKLIHARTIKAGLSDILGEHGSINVQGEAVQKLDDLSNSLCKDYLRQSDLFCAMASEEEEGIVDMEDHGDNARYVIAFDPLDGSSNIDVNIGVGTIFSVNERLEGGDPTDVSNFLQPGTKQVLAGYILYSTSTVMVFTMGDGVYEFTLDPEVGEFVISRENLQLPEELKYISFNHYNQPRMRPEEVERVWSIYNDNPKASGRYIGSLVADFHRNLIKGGVFFYPEILKDSSYCGKLRLNYEAKPMAWLIEQAGGTALEICGGKSQRILDIEPTELHQRVALAIGNTTAVEQLQ